MELVEGISLERLLLQRGRLRPGEVIPLGASVARGLAADQARDVVHRDVKPANVLLGRADWPLLSDFGIAGAGNREERGGHISGTPPYMSPEQAQGKSKEVGPAADVYALGAVLYECLTGRPPFKAATHSTPCYR